MKTRRAVGVLLSTIALVALSCSKSDTDQSPANQAKPDVRPEFQALIGRWLRPDGGYVVEIKQIGADGKLDAAYYNPKPIHVSQARASRDGATTKVFIELRDTGYPGSTYDLFYDPMTDQLKGVYFQAAVDQRFEVLFVRLKE